LTRKKVERGATGGEALGGETGRFPHTLEKGKQRGGGGLWERHEECKIGTVGCEEVTMKRGRDNQIIKSGENLWGN